MYSTPSPRVPQAPGVPCPATIQHGMADTPRSAADTPRSEVFSKFFSFSRGKKHFFQKVLKKWSSIQKNRKYFYPFLGGGSDPKVIKITFF